MSSNRTRVTPGDIHVVEQLHQIRQTSTVSEQCKLMKVAWAILSSAYSESHMATIQVSDASQPHRITAVCLSIESGHKVHDVRNSIEHELQNDTCSPGEKPSKPAQELAKVSGMAKALLASEASDTILSTASETGFDLVLVCHASTSASDCFSLKGIAIGMAMDQTELFQVLNRLGNIMTQSIDNGDLEVGQLDLMCALDRSQLGIWCKTMPPSLDACLHDLLELQSQRYPSNEAICAWDGSLTYRELDQRASALARSLVATGVKPGDYVPLLFEKSKWHVVSIIAVLKAGAAFVALEPTIPDGRIEVMLEQLGSIPVIMASESQSSRVYTLAKHVLTVCDNTIFDDTLPTSGLSTSPDSPAYLIFTSGSTGKRTPKGVIIEHRQLSTMIQSANQRIVFTPDMRKLQMTAFNFDLSLTEIFCPLLGGGCVCIPSEWARFNDLAHAVKALNANFGSFSPSFLATLLVEDFPTLKTILLAGERVPADLATHWSDRGRRIVHMYGPTECTVASCFLDGAVQAHYDGFIGDASACNIWIVDANNHERLMPLGAPGEIVVEGPIVGRCYFGDPRKTQECFIACPSWFASILDRQPSRFYKTGDLGRLTKSGGVEIIGRKDTQTKIRGLRVEIQEIEHQIRTVSGSQMGVAVEVRNPRSILGEEMLVAFLAFDHQSKSRQEPGVTVLWEDLVTEDTQYAEVVYRIMRQLPNVLPTYMIPAAYLPVSSIPFTNSYKLDRKALKERANLLSDSEIQIATTRRVLQTQTRQLTGKETLLQSICAQVLHAVPEKIDVQQTFFSLGGDSLKAMALVGAARRKDLNFTVAQLSQHSISKVCQLTGNESHMHEEIEAYTLVDSKDIHELREIASQQWAVQSEMIEDILPVLDMQRFYLDRQRCQPYSWQVPLVLDLPGNIDTSRLQRAWETLLGRYSITRSRFIESSSGVFQIVLRQDEIHWRSETDLADLLLALKTVDLSFGPKPHQSAVVTSTDQNAKHLVWYLNHAISDQIMEEHMNWELFQLYEEQDQHRPNSPSFRNVVHQRLGSEISISRSFWQSHLAGARYRPLFEVSENSQTMACSRLDCCARIISAGRLKVFEYPYVTAVLAIALSHFTSEKDVPFFLIRTGRTSIAGSENTMGPLIARAPLRVCIEQNLSASDLFSRVDRDFQESSKHEIVREEDFTGASTEAAAHLRHAVYLNFLPPAAGLMHDADNPFPINDVWDGKGYQTLPFLINGEVRDGNIDISVRWDEQLIARERVQAFLSILETAFHKAGQMGHDMTVNEAFFL